MKKPTKKLSLHRETVRDLSAPELRRAAGGILDSARNSCNDTVVQNNCCWKPGATFDVSCYDTRCFCPV